MSAQENSARSAAVLALAWVVFMASSLGVALQSGIGPELSQVVANGAYMAVGTLLVVRRSGNVIGPLLMAIGLGWMVAIAGDVTAETLAESGHAEAAGWALLLTTLLTVPLLWLFVPMWLLFPDGRTGSGRVRRVVIGSGVYLVIPFAVAVFALPSGVDPTRHPYPHPFVADSLAEPMADLFVAVTAPIVLLSFGSAAFLVARYRHSGSIERRQIGWVGLAAIVYTVSSLFNVFFDPLADIDRGHLLLDAVGFVLIPMAMGMAIMRYRLYEIDTIINRSLVFGALAAFIAGVYIAIVVGVGSLLGGDGFGLSILASVLVAMAFQPVRRRVQHWANRLVFGERATPYEVLVRFSRRSAELSDEDLLDRIPQLIAEGTGASSATIWAKDPTGFRSESVWPEGAAARRLDGAEQFEDPDADFSLPVLHDGELLGGLSLVKPGGETVTPTEEALLADLAAGLGLVLRNARLTRELRRQLVELEASRERVLAASDEARRALEHDLDSGPQQQLVALKVKLGPTRVLAERAGAEQTAALLAQLETDAGDTIKAVRDFASGIYPPLLEAEGLEVAIDQQARAAAIPVDIVGAGIGRYPREVEAAVYFSVLEALQNTAKYAAATTATITLADEGGALRFEVRDDGQGFDPDSTAPGAGLTGMADRLDAVGGEITVESTPSTGTVVAGQVRVAALSASA